MTKRREHLPEPPSPSLPSPSRFAFAFAVVALFLLVLLADADRDALTGAVVYRDSYYGGSGFGLWGFSFSDIYYTYGYVVDAVIFLLIFLGVGKAVFKKHFGEGGTAVYVGLGLLLAFALLLWEERSGIYLLESFGRFAMVFLFLLLAVGIFSWMKGAGATTPWALALMVVGFIIILFFMKVSGMTTYEYVMDFFCDFIPPVCGFFSGFFSFLDSPYAWRDVILALLMGFFIYIILKHAFASKKKNIS